jgi:photosystem II stability/assembly factor-like uncharacterized protein/tetratricopeptide (TPR) repeat protein
VTELLNPYIAGAPVTDERMFFGREDVFEWIEHNLAGQYADHILVIHGQRRVGKTSVLRQLPVRLPSRYIPVFFDLQGRTHTTLDRFLWWLSREIVRVLKQDHAQIIPLPEKEAFAHDPDYLESQFLPNLRLLLGDHVLLLTFDEFDCLEEAEIRDSLGRPLVDYLRRLMGQPGLNFIFSIGSSGRKLENMQASYTEFFKAALYKKISYLKRQDAQNLIAGPVRGVLEYETAAVGEIFRITSGHPYFTQLICHELFARCLKTEARRVRKDDVMSVLDDVVERGTVNLKFVWDEASDLEKWCLASLANMQGKVELRTLGEFLRKQRVRFGNPDLESSLVHLREKDVLTADNRFVIDLLRLWLKQNRPLEQVREELTEVNPISNRYIEIGLEFRDSGQFERAIESFQQALEIDTDNLQAMVGVAQVHLDQKAYAQAVAAFENALAVDDEDVPARSGLCEAHLALGDFALAKGRTREAIQSYERVLAINADHTEARQRMAEIHRRKAEQALTEGKGEQALSDFGAALKYTPEDEGLVARYTEVQGQWRATVVSGLVARAERERASENWDQAIAALEEALKLSPEEVDLQEEVESLRGKRREAHLRDLRSRAKTEARLEKWDEALSKWREILELAPDDRQEIEQEVERVERLKSTALAYTQAQAALTEKSYDEAVRLLKGIVVQDETYKGASRLLAEAIELRRTERRFWQTRVFRLGAAASVGLAAVAAIVIAARNLSSTAALPGPLTTEPPQITALPTALPTAQPAAAKPTSTVGPTPTPIPMAWARLNAGLFIARDMITTIVFDPTDPGVIYAGTENAGVYKSIDGGQSWQPAHGGMERAKVLSLVIDPADPAILYAGTELGGVYRTEDRAQTWRAVNRGIDLPGWNEVGAVVIDRLNSQHLYYGHGFDIYETVDGGESWHKTTTTACPSLHHNLVIHPQDGQTLFVQTVDNGTGCHDGIYVSRDGGRTWGMSLETGPPADSPALAIDSADGSHLYAADQSKLYASADGGSSWSVALDHPCDVVVFGPDGYDVAYCSFGGKLQVTQDGGITWRIIRYAEVTALAVPPHDTESIWAGGEGLAFSNDAGVTWTERSSGLGARHVELGIDPADSEIVYLQTSNGWLYRSSDHGRTWDLIEDQGSGMAFDPARGALYRSAGESILQSQDHGDSWTNIQMPQDTSFVGTNPQRPGTLYAASNQCAAESPIHVSVDGGRTWREYTGYVPCADTRAFVGSGEGQRVYLVGDVEMARSDDAGETWQQCGQGGYAARYGSRLTLDPRDDDHLYLSTRSSGVMVSQDGCRSWLPSNNGLASLFVNAIAVDPANPDTLYAGTDGGAYVSFDGGASWGDINDGLLGATVVYSIVVDPQSNVYAATPYGIFELGSR